MKNIINLTIFGGLLVVLGSAGFIVDPVFLIPAAGVGVFAPEAISELE